MPGAACGIGAGGTATLSPAAGGGTTPVLGSGAGVGSGTLSAKAGAAEKAQPANDRHEYRRRAEFAQAPYRHILLPLMRPIDASVRTPTTNAIR